MKLWIFYIKWHLKTHIFTNEMVKNNQDCWLVSAKHSTKKNSRQIKGGWLSGGPGVVHTANLGIAEGIWAPEVFLFTSPLCVCICWCHPLCCQGDCWAPGSIDSSGLCLSSFDWKVKTLSLPEPPSNTKEGLWVTVLVLSPTCPSHSDPRSWHGADKTVIFVHSRWVLNLKRPLQSNSAFTPHLFPSPDRSMSCFLRCMWCQFSVFHSLPRRPLPQAVSTPCWSQALPSTSTHARRPGTAEKIDRRKDHIKHFKFWKWVAYRRFRFLIFWFELASVNGTDPIYTRTYLTHVLATPTRENHHQWSRLTQCQEWKSTGSTQGKLSGWGITASGSQEWRVLSDLLRPTGPFAHQ